MNVFEVSYRVVLPIFLIIGVGTVLDRAVRLDVRTLSKLNFYVFVPALAFVSLMDAEIPGGTMAAVAVFAVLHVLLLGILSRFLFARWESRETNTVLILGAMFFNCGNYGFPLVAMAFGKEYWGVAAVVLMIQNLLTFTVGVWVYEKEGRSIPRVAAGLLRIPIIYAVSVPFLLRWLDVAVPHPVNEALNYLARGLIPAALITLGAQLSRSPGVRNALPILTLSGLRLVVSPLVAAGILLLPVLHIPETARTVLLVMAGLPVAVNVYILASQYDRGAEFASQGVFWSTLLSAGSLSVLLALVS